MRCGIFSLKYNDGDVIMYDWATLNSDILVFFGFGISDIIAAKNPDIEIYIGEYIETDSMGTGSTRKTYCFF